MIDRFGGLVSLLFGVAVVVSFYEIIVRYFYNAPTVWAHETTIGLVAVCYLFGGLFCLARDQHIRIGLLYFSTNGGTRRILDAINSALTLFFALAMIYASWFMVEKSWFSPVGDFKLERSG
ncbi:MAG: TRAP transporter small permease, partial [Candidatus Competibacteraceae bacterium]|nr:TRAP transporter small permease [Candidatus Competibacteraceae bacterium]